MSTAQEIQLRAQQFNSRADTFCGILNEFFNACARIVLRLIRQHEREHDTALARMADDGCPHA